ncbi:Transcription factor [Entomophthora muscae]|uniref:Transcription factor n=1 Tax=Entomophthora muscae TaxID=34485 RepID=A0ACC2TQ86_9FUNG|nr:Transcription factor [Entomophthora muscae]
MTLALFSWPLKLANQTSLCWGQETSWANHIEKKVRQALRLDGLRAEPLNAGVQIGLLNIGHIKSKRPRFQASMFSYQSYPQFDCYLAEPTLSSFTDDMTQASRVVACKPATSLEESGTQRANMLIRNRISAAKCRQRKKEWVAQQQSRTSQLHQTNVQLTQEILLLREEISSLKLYMACHTNCSVYN